LDHSSYEAELTLGLLQAIGKDSRRTQRSISRELGVALGLVNAYLKRCVKKGLIKVSQAPSNRYAYYLTPKGFAEKSRLTAEFLRQSLGLFRQAQFEYVELLTYCEMNQMRQLALHGFSDLAEIVSLCAKDFDVEIVGIVDPRTNIDSPESVLIYSDISQLSNIDAHILTDLYQPQKVYDSLVKLALAEKVLAPRLLGVEENIGSKSRAHS